MTNITFPEVHIFARHLLKFPATQTSPRCISHQRSGQTEDGQEGTCGGEGGVFADSGLFPHLYVSSSDVIAQRLGHHRLPLLTHSDVASGGIHTYLC